jgi:hypothetical protein
LPYRTFLLAMQMSLVVSTQTLTVISLASPLKEIKVSWEKLSNGQLE